MSDALHTVAKLLDDVSAEYVVIGGHAVNAWLEPRFTADVDVTLHANPETFTRIRRTFLGAGFTVEREHGATQSSGPDFVRFVSVERDVVVEFQLAKTRLQKEVIRRAVVDDAGARLATPEDLIVLKLIADRKKDRHDLAGLALLDGLDWDYIERCCREWDLLERLSELRASDRSLPAR